LNRTLVGGMALGFTAGYVDTVSFVTLFGLFTAHVTGNFVLIGSELTQPSNRILMKLLVFPAFIAAVAAARLLALAIERGGRAPARGLLLLQIALLAAGMLCGWRAEPILDAGAPWALAAGMLVAAGMGVQNAAGRLAFADLAPTTVMTGNVTQFVLDLVDLARGPADAAVRARLHKLLWPIFGFAAGAICGAVLTRQVALSALALPLVILAGLALLQRGAR
jgi:uncharacterized membrane protein YoaK (UPF0700 family)